MTYATSDYFLPPSKIASSDTRIDVGWRLGACLYIPGSRPALRDDIRRCASHGISSVVLCLEDSIDSDVEPLAIHNVRLLIESLASEPSERPMIFVRPRNIEQFAHLQDSVALSPVTGVALPKFSPTSGPQWLSLIQELSTGRFQPLYAMPIFESRELLIDSSRGSWLSDCREVLEAHIELICALRIGVVDLAGHLGIRRPPHMTAYEFAPISQGIAGILGEFASRAKFPVISGGVWEHLPRTPVRGHLPNRSSMPGTHEPTGPMSTDQSFRREVMIDRAHGLVGKSIIHPGQAFTVNAAQVVSFDEWIDACSVLNQGGAARSPRGNKMNESEPHRRWAERILVRAHYWGVLQDGLDWWSDEPPDEHRLGIQL